MLQNQASPERIVELSRLAGERAGHLFRTGQLLCSEAVLCVLNETFRGGLSEEQAIGMASGFPEGLGGSGCLCGALSGGVLAIGLFLGKSRRFGREGREARDATERLHRAFKERVGATCCRVLTRPVKHQTRAHFSQCARLTGIGAELATMVLLQVRPELSAITDGACLCHREGWLSCLLLRLTSLFFR